jgi:predicted O-linked N-acetylglucosamine transferase (SPINDLY family)
MRNHDHAEFEITLYSNSVRSDRMTEQFESSADRWHTIAGWPDGRVVEQVRRDGIDILADLALHTARNRLAVFAHKPAPVQLTFAGYPGTTGLSAIDYRLTDPHLDPLGLDDACYSEESYRLPHSFWCFDPQSEEPAVGALPASKNGFVTFGCLNNFCKTNDDVFNLWAQVLREAPKSRLVLLAKEGSHRQRTVNFFADKGIGAGRVSFFSPQPRHQYLALYNEIDIGLDTLPYNGHSTSLDSFWMGVPVVTLIGKTVVGRAGLSQLTNLGLPELAADTPKRFVETAVTMAGDFSRLTALRSSMRRRMKSSPLMDAERFARGIEQAYRTMWQKWCATVADAAP